jgi:integrase
MPRRSKGYSAYAHQDKATKKWYGRLELKKPDGRKKSYARQAKNKTHAKQLADELEAKYVSGGTEALDAENMTVGDLVEKYRAAKVVDPVYDGEIKVAGMISKQSAEDEIKELLEYWGVIPVQKITHAAIEEYKLHMLKKPTVWKWREGEEIKQKPRGTPRKMSSVNHLLRRLRTMLNFAVRKGWLVKNPFNAGDPLISDAAEVPRNRAEQEKELQKLLDGCVGPREHLRVLVLIMADSALRLTEAKRLVRAQIDFEAGVIYLKARITKRNIPRIVSITDRLADELRKYCEKVKDDATPILPQGENKTAWKTLKEKVGISDDLQLRDLRGWGTTRIAQALASANLPWQWGMKATGHTQTKTYERYLKTDKEIARKTGEALKKFNKKIA